MCPELQIAVNADAASSEPATWLFEGADGHPAGLQRAVRGDIIHEPRQAHRLGQLHLHLWRVAEANAPVMIVAILKEFCDMAGERGRYSHKPSDPPVYDYQLASKQRSIIPLSKHSQLSESHSQRVSDAHIHTHIVVTVN